MTEPQFQQIIILMKNAMQKLFGFEKGTHKLRTEIVAGVTTFLTMAYILAVNPGIFSALADQGMPTPLPEITETRHKLPIYQYRSEFLSLLSKNQSVLISGETGCGKSTQVCSSTLNRILRFLSIFWKKLRNAINLRILISSAHNPVV